MRKNDFKIFAWLKVEILGVFLNYLTPGDIYLVGDCETLQFFIQMELSQNKKLFPHVLLHFWNLPQILNIFEKKDDCGSQCISESADCQELG